MPSGLTLNLIQEGAAIRPSPCAPRPSPLAIRHSPLATCHSPLATRHSPLAIRHSLCLTPNPSPEERGAGLVWRIYVRLLYRLCFGTIAFIQKNRLRCHSPLTIRHSPFAPHPSHFAPRPSHFALRTSHIAHPPYICPKQRRSIAPPRAGRKVRAAVGTAPCEKRGHHAGNSMTTDSVAEI